MQRNFKKGKEMIRIFETVKNGALSIQTLILSVSKLTVIPRKDESIYLESSQTHYKVKSITHDIRNDSIDIYVEQ